ncbi:MAG: MFS transporter [Coriobacteriales bacterium]|nr:MFS transporter [Coriobacteriales bacterium]
MEHNQSWKRSFLIITAGQALSQIGSSAVSFSLIWWLASFTGSAMVMGISGLVAFLPMALLSPAAGIIADKYNRKIVCMASDLAVGIVAALFALGLAFIEAPVWLALVILFVRAAVGAFQPPAYQAMIPQIVPAEELVRAGGWGQMVASGSYILGPVLGAALYAAFPLHIILLSDLVGALLACLALFLVYVPSLAPAASEPSARENTSAAEKPGFILQVREGIEVFKQDRSLALIMIIEALCSLFYLPLSTFYPLMTSSYFAASAWHGSAIEALYAIGMLVTAALFGSVLKVKRHLLVAYIGLMGIGLTSVVSGLLPPTMAGWFVFAAMCMLMGGFSNVYSIPLIAYMQTTIDPSRMGRAFSILTLLASVTMPVGLAIAGPIAEAIGVNVWFAVAGFGMVLAAGIGFLGNHKLQSAVAAE